MAGASYVAEAALGAEAGAQTAAAEAARLAAAGRRSVAQSAEVAMKVMKSQAAVGEGEMPARVGGAAQLPA